MNPETGFFVAVAVGHRIHEHGDTPGDAIRFAEWSGVPDLQIKAHKATASTSSTTASPTVSCRR